MKRSVIAALALCISMPLHAFSLEETVMEYINTGMKQLLPEMDSSDAKEKRSEKKESAKSSAAPAPSDQTIEVAFSPDHGAEELVLKSIKSAKKSIRLAAYSFTSPKVVAALLDAHKRKVDVQLAVDHKHNFDVCKDGKRCAGAAAVGALVNAGIPVRTVKAYAIQHDKFIVLDSKHVQTGSFNYSKAAASSNAENVLVIWNNPAIAKKYLAQWERHWEQGNKPSLKY